MVAESVPKVYNFGRGINQWLDTFSIDYEDDLCAEAKVANNDPLHYEFRAALGSACPATYPDINHYEDVECLPKIKFELKRATTSRGYGSISKLRN